MAARPDLFGWSQGPGAAALTRGGLVVPEIPETAGNLATIRDGLRLRTAALRRSVHLRHVDAGSDGAEEQEIQALLGPVYDIHRLGIFFTASPRHADVLLVTGAGARGMTEPLRRTFDGMPDPKLVIAVGTDAVSGGLISPSYATTGGVGDAVGVDAWLPGSPPSPFSILHALLLVLGRLPAREEAHSDERRVRGRADPAGRRSRGGPGCGRPLAAPDERALPAGRGRVGLPGGGRRGRAGRPARPGWPSAAGSGQAR